jgi:hypothetical protein
MERPNDHHNSNNNKRTPEVNRIYVVLLMRRLDMR